MEFSSRRSAESSKSAEGVNKYAYKPFDRKAALEAVKEMKELVDSLPGDADDASREAAEKEARDNVIASIRKAESPARVRDIDQPKDLEGREFRLVDNENSDEDKSELGDDIKPIEADKQSSNIDDVYRTLFGTPSNIKNMLGDQQFSKWQNIVNQDINSGKYAEAKYEDGLVYHIGKVNEGSMDERGDDWDTMKYRSQDERLRYSEQVKNIDPKVWGQINKTVYALGATLGDNSREYHDALNKINQDIYDGRYKNAEYIVIRNEGEESEEGVINFNDDAPETKQEDSAPETDNTETYEEPILDTQKEEPEPELTNTQKEEPEPEPVNESKEEEPEPANESKEEPFEGEMTETIEFEGRKCVDTLKKIYANLNKADAEQKDRFRYLYENLSATSKIIPQNKDEEQQKLGRIFAYKDMINMLYQELSGE